MSKIVFSLLVDDEAGILTRISGLFARRGYNIDSITAGAAEIPSKFRITIATSGEDEVLEQIQKQLAKLVDVVSIRSLPPEASVTRELMLIKVAAEPQDRQEIASVANIFRANVIDVSTHSMVIEMTGNQSKLEAFTALLDKYHIMEIARTGITGLTRGSLDAAEAKARAEAED